MSAAEIRSLAAAAGIAPGVAVLDLCCGVAGPGRWITRNLGCTYTGVDASAGAIDLAHARAGDLDCRFEVARIPPVPGGPYDVVMLLETMLAFPDKDSLLRAISSVLRPGGRFAFTLEEGEPLTDVERRTMPDAETVWLTPWADLERSLEQVGLGVRRKTDVSAAHRVVADALAAGFVADRLAITARIGERALEDLLSAHRHWSAWLQSGRVRKLAVVATKKSVDASMVARYVGSSFNQTPDFLE